MVCPVGVDCRVIRRGRCLLRRSRIGAFLAPPFLKQLLTPAVVATIAGLCIPCARILYRNAAFGNPNKRCAMIRYGFSLLIVLAVASLASARDWYVNNVAGDDAKDGTSDVAVSVQSGPVRTIARALRGARKADRIILANTSEPYRESFTLCGHLGGFSHAPFTIVGNGAVLDGTQPVPADDWEFAYGEVFRFRPERMPYEILYLDGKALPRGGATNAAGERAPLAPLEWNYSEGYIYFRPEAGKLPQQYGLSLAALTVGITLYQVQWVDIQDLTVQGFQLDGLNAHDSVFHARVSGVVSRLNGRSGFSIGGASQVELLHCEASDNGVAQLRSEGYSHTLLTNCTLQKGAAPALKQLEHSQVKETIAR